MLSILHLHHVHAAGFFGFIFVCFYDRERQEILTGSCCSSPPSGLPVSEDHRCVLLQPPAQVVLGPGPWSSVWQPVSHDSVLLLAPQWLSLTAFSKAAFDYVCKMVCGKVYTCVSMCAYVCMLLTSRHAPEFRSLRA